MVRLLPCALGAYCEKNSRFNPTMVRLLPLCGYGAMLALCEFQSHNGAIAALPSVRVRSYEVLVSIPQWCDCCVAMPQFAEAVARCFNPTMVRLLPRQNFGVWGQNEAK